MLFTRPLLFIATGVVAVAAIASDASAGIWTRHHPARTEIAGRARFQQHRITEDRRDGTLTADQAHALRGEVHGIHQDARADALANGGHLTGDEARSLNGQLNATSSDIPH